MDRQTDRRMDRLTYGLMNGQMGSWTDEQTDRLKKLTVGQPG